MNVGILAIQGSKEEHFSAALKAEADPLYVRTISDLNKANALIIPGGESTVIGMLMKHSGLKEEIARRVKNGMPVWGTCAGAILLAKRIEGKHPVDTLSLMDITIQRNAYGRQLNSFEDTVEFDFDTEKRKIPAVFIRAPKILKCGAGVKIKARYEGLIVAASEKNMLVTTFHPELTDDLSVYRYFLSAFLKT